MKKPVLKHCDVVISWLYNHKAKNQFVINANCGCAYGAATLSRMTSWCQFHQHFMSSFCAKILLPKNYKPKFKNLKAVQRTLVWLSFSKIFYKQLFIPKFFCAPFMCLQFGSIIFWRKYFGAKAAHKMLVTLTSCITTISQ